jgi:hypothetical protein
MMLIWFIIIVLLGWLILMMIGRMLPKTYVVERSELIEAPISQVWTLIVNHAKEKDWRSNLAEVEKAPSQEDHKPIWKELQRDRRTSLLLKTIVSEAPYRLVREIVNNKDIGGQYQYELVPLDETCRLKLKQEITIYKPFKRFAFNLSSSKHAFVDQYMADLKQRILHLKEEE